MLYKMKLFKWIGCLLWCSEVQLCSNEEMDDGADQRRVVQWREQWSRQGTQISAQGATGVQAGGMACPVLQCPTNGTPLCIRHRWYRTFHFHIYWYFDLSFDKYDDPGVKFQHMIDAESSRVKWVISCDFMFESQSVNFFVQITAFLL